MIKLKELRTTKIIHTFWATVLTYIKNVNRVNPSGINIALRKLVKDVPSSGPMIASKFKRVEAAYRKFKQEAEHFSAYIRSKSYD